jgi:hypothetical protein
VRDLYARAKRALGRRGGVLVTFGIMYAILGVKAWIEPADDAGRFILYALLPEPARVALWALPALLAIVTLLLRGRWASDAVGFGALVVPPVVMAFSYAWSTVAFLLGATGWAYGWSSASIWLLILALVLIVSGWGEVRAPEPDSEGARA